MPIKLKIQYFFFKSFFSIFDLVNNYIDILLYLHAVKLIHLVFLSLIILYLKRVYVFNLHKTPNKNSKI